MDVVCEERQRMTEAGFKAKTERLTLAVIQLAEELPPQEVGRVIGRQLLRCGTSVGANYRAACRARSQSEMVAKLGIVLEEADEVLNWLDLAVAANVLPNDRIEAVRGGADEIVAMTVASIKKLRSVATSRPSKI